MPVSSAASYTAAATDSTTALLKTLGMTYSSCSSSSPITPAMARAAARFIGSLIAVADAESAPRKMPGKASTLLIWLG